jgi:periplasmic protein TonB
VSAVAESATAGARLAWAVAFATVAHAAVILGVSFAPPLTPGPSEVPTLEVTLLDSPLPGQAPPDDARYLAQASQEGAGNVEEQLPPEFHPHPPAPESQDAMARGLEVEYRPARPEIPAAERVASWNAAIEAAIAPLDSEAEARPAELPPEGGVTRVTATGEKEYFVSVNARESVFAEYLAAWKARMERLGTLNFPAIAAGQRSGNPVLEVAVAADGSLREVRVTRSSGHPALDQAAVDLVRLASPYDPFPAAVRAQFDVLRFAYEWRFIEGRAGQGVTRARER